MLVDWSEVCSAVLHQSPLALCLFPCPQNMNYRVAGSAVRRLVGLTNCYCSCFRHVAYEHSKAADVERGEEEEEGEIHHAHQTVFAS